jgi:glycosyltransferase involved in cell wall biosynthesis
MTLSKNPIISVIMSIYNEPKEWLETSIESILNQTYSNIEFIIINDNPKSDLNKTILNDYAANDKRIVVISNKDNIGLTKSLNKGLKLSSGEFIARMDADDISLDYRLKIQLDALIDNDDIGVCGSSIKLFGLNSSTINNINRYPTGKEKIRTEFLFSNPICHPAVMFKKKLFIENGIFFYDEGVKRAQDFDLWHRALSFTNFKNINKVLLKYRVSLTQISAKGKKDQVIVADNIRAEILKKIIEVSEREVLLHNKVCNFQLVSNQKEMRDLEIWFDKLYLNVLENDLLDKNYLINRLNFYLQRSYLNSFKGFKCFEYFKSKTYKASNKKLEYFMVFVIKYILKFYRKMVSQ